jgi:hypothetical protein
LYSIERFDDSKRTLLDHNETQLKKQERITLHQAQRVAFMSAEQVERQLRYDLCLHFVWHCIVSLIDLWLQSEGVKSDDTPILDRKSECVIYPLPESSYLRRKKLHIYPLPESSYLRRKKLHIYPLPESSHHFQQYIFIVWFYGYGRFCVFSCYFNQFSPHIFNLTTTVP